MIPFKTIDTSRMSDVKREKSSFILKNLLPMPSNTVNMISSIGGLGKTYFSIIIASHFVAETNQNCMCWFSEDHNGEIAIRYDVLKKQGMIDDINQDKIFLVNSEPMQLAKTERGTFVSNGEAIAGLKKDCLLGEIKLLIIDPLLAFYGGNENDNSQARIFMQAFIDWTKEHKITIIFIHHSARGGGGTRGAGAFRDAVRTLYELDYIRDEAGEVKLDEKDAGYRQISLVKDNRNAYEYMRRLYGEGITEQRILPRRIEVAYTKYQKEEEKYEMPII